MSGVLAAQFAQFRRRIHDCLICRRLLEPDPNVEGLFAGENGTTRFAGNTAKRSDSIALCRLRSLRYDAFTILLKIAQRFNAGSSMNNKDEVPSGTTEPLI